jgi:hypothetical protein
VTGVWTQVCVCKAGTLPLQPHLQCSGYFGDGVSRTICSSWSQTTILPMLASQVTWITGMNHWHLALFFVLFPVFNILFFSWKGNLGIF